MSLDFNDSLEVELIDFIHQNYGLEVFSPGLLRTRPLYLPFIEKFKSLKIKVSIIAGTNGKGQTAHTLAYLIKSSQLGYALWTSPHILSLRERFEFHFGQVTYEVLKNEIYSTHEFIKLNFPTLKISFYEFLFLVFLRMSLSVLKAKDHLILEVGLGGKLDAVNHFDADCMCITSISRDHQMILGNRYDLILGEKIAVARAHKPLFTNFSLEYLNQLTKKYCDDHSVLWKPLLNKELSGNYFEENQAMAKALFTYLEPLHLDILDREIPLFKGRREEMTFNGNTLIFIGAHNTDGVRRMIELFSSENQSEFPSQLLVSFSKRPIGEVEIMLKSMREFFGIRSIIRLASFNHPKALDESAIIDLEKRSNKINKGLLNFVSDWKSELKNTKNQKILVCGSYYFIGEVQRFIHTRS